MSFISHTFLLHSQKIVESLVLLCKTGLLQTHFSYTKVHAHGQMPSIGTFSKSIAAMLYTVHSQQEEE